METAQTPNGSRLMQIARRKGIGYQTLLKMLTKACSVKRDGANGVPVYFFSGTTAGLAGTGATAAPGTIFAVLMMSNCGKFFSK